MLIISIFNNYFHAEYELLQFNCGKKMHSSVYWNSPRNIFQFYFKSPLSFMCACPTSPSNNLQMTIFPMAIRNTTTNCLCKCCVTVQEHHCWIRGYPLQPGAHLTQQFLQVFNYFESVTGIILTGFWLCQILI